MTKNITARNRSHGKHAQSVYLTGCRVMVPVTRLPKDWPATVSMVGPAFSGRKPGPRQIPQPLCPGCAYVIHIEYIQHGGSGHAGNISSLDNPQRQGRQKQIPEMFQQSPAQLYITCHREAISGEHQKQHQKHTEQETGYGDSQQGKLIL